MWEDSLVGVPGKDFPHRYGEEVGGRSASERAVACSRLRVSQEEEVSNPVEPGLPALPLSHQRHILISLPKNRHATQAHAGWSDDTPALKDSGSKVTSS